MTMQTVKLYEDNAGGLYLHKDGTETVWSGLQRVQGGRFADDAATLADGDTSDWALDTYPATEIDDTNMVAIYQGGKVEIVGRPGLAAEIYLYGRRQLTASEMGRKGGAATTEAKRAASAGNGKRGGRPRKTAEGQA